MDTIRYCDGALEQLTHFKAAVYDLMRIEARISDAGEGPPAFEPLHLLIEEIERGALELKDAPPIDDGLFREAIDAKLERLRNMINENGKRVLGRTLPDRLARG